MVPPAPARFSTITCWPSASEKAGASVRAVMSTLPLGGQAMTILTGSLRKSSTTAGQEKNTAAVKIRRHMGPSEVGDGDAAEQRIGGFLELRIAIAAVVALRVRDHQPDPAVLGVGAEERIALEDHRLGPAGEAGGRLVLRNGMHAHAQVALLRRRTRAVRKRLEAAQARCRAGLIYPLSPLREKSLRP